MTTTPVPDPDIHQARYYLAAALADSLGPDGQTRHSPSHAFAIATRVLATATGSVDGVLENLARLLDSVSPEISRPIDEDELVAEARARASAKRLGHSLIREMDRDIVMIRRLADALEGTLLAGERLATRAHSAGAERDAMIAVIADIRMAYEAGLELGDTDMQHSDPEATLDAIWDVLQKAPDAAQPRCPFRDSRYPDFRCALTEHHEGDHAEAQR